MHRLGNLQFALEFKVTPTGGLYIANAFQFQLYLFVNQIYIATHFTQGDSGQCITIDK